MLRKFKHIVPLALALALASCTKSKYDINTDPNSPSSLPVSILLTGVEQSVGSALAFGSGISSTLEVYMHRIVVRESANGYGATPADGNIGSQWNTSYISVLTNANIIIDKGTADGNMQFVGIAKILKAYTFSQLVDVYGDIPFTEANKLLSLVKNPKFDDDATIYPALIAMLDEGITNLNAAAANPLKPGTSDVIYGGSVTKWVKAANTIKLKLYTQMRLVKNVSADVNALLAGGNLISTASESFVLPYGTTNKNPGFGDYSATQRGTYISPWFYEIMSGYNQRLFTGNADPRTPYYWFKQLPPGQANTNDANNPTEYRDGSFVSIYFGSTGPNSGFAQQNTMTLIGMYPVGGKYDDGKGVTLTPNTKLDNTSGTGAAPYKFITYADRLYMEAELMKTGVITGDARAKTLAAITESFKQVDYIITTYVKPSQTVPLVVPLSTSYITNVMNDYDASPAKQLEIIMTEKWINSFGSAVDAYTDYRRTGFPILFDPNSYPGNPHLVQPPLNGNPLVIPQKAVPVQQILPFPLSLYWPQGELNSNQSAPTQKSQSTYKVFWMP